MSSVKAKVGRGVALLTIGRGMVNALGFLSTLALARLLTPADFGLVAIATSLLAIVQSVTEMSLGQALIHHTDPSEAHFDTAFTLNLLRGVVIGGLFAAAGPLVGYLYHDPRLIGVMAALGASVLVGSLGNIRLTHFTRALVFRQNFIISVSIKLTAVVVSVALAWATRSYWALVFGTVAQQLMQIVIGYAYLPRRPRLTITHARELWSFSIWLTLSQAVSTLNYRFDQVLVGSFFSRTVMGQYTVGDNLALLPTREATMPLGQTLFPAFVKLRDDLPRLQQAYIKAQTAVSGVAFPISFGCALVAEPLVRLCMGEKWLPTATIISILASSFGLQTIGSAVAPLAMAMGKTQTMFRRELGFFFFQIPVILIGIWAGGLMGVLLARWVTGAAYLFLSVTLVRRFIGLPIARQLGANVRGLVGVGIMSVVVVAVRSVTGVDGTSMQLILSLACMSIAGAISYIAARWLLWHMAGYPAGAEEEVARIVGRLLQRQGKMPA